VKIPTVNAELFCRAQCTVGEGPFWHEDRLYWVDIFKRRLHSCDSEGRDLRSLSVSSDLGAAAPWAEGFILGTKNGIETLSHGGMSRLLPSSPPLTPELRFNDGKLDPAGRFWCGTTTYQFIVGAGALYRVECDGDISCVLEGITLSNGLDWDEHAGRFYFIDTMSQRVDVFDYDLASGDIAKRRVAFEVPKEFGIPDGMARDAAGRLWVACWGGGHVIGFDSRNGHAVSRIHVPTQLTSSCWVGPDCRALYITTARLNLPPETLAKEPLAGSIFRADLPGL
jgi:sugar lactone lactonase YvrE